MDDDKNIQLPSVSKAELTTLVCALKLASVRYGLLLQLANQRGETVIEQDQLQSLGWGLDALLQEAA